MKKNGFLTATICFFSVLLICSMPAAHGDELKKVALFPFDVYAEKDRASLQKQVGESIQNNLLRSRAIQIIPQDVLMKSLNGRQIDEKTALQVGREVGADVAIIGSVSQLGKVVSIDAKLIDVKSGQAPQGVFVQGTLAEGIGNLSARLTDDLILKIAAEKRIASIVVMGNRKIETSAIMNVLKESPGKLFSPADLSADIKAIYKTGYFSDVKADVKDTPGGKVITFTVQERPMISNVVVKGNDAIETKEIEAVLTVRLRQFLDVDKIKEDVEKIRTLYHNKGYFNVEIKYDIEMKSEKEAILTYTIVEGRRLYIKSISFTGVQAFSPKELKNMMDTSEYGLFHFFTDSGILKEDKLKEDVKKLNAFYLNNGYINAKVGDPEITHDKRWIYITIPVIEGKRFKVGNVTISGDTISVPREKLLSELQIKKKEFYDREAIMRDIDYLTQAYNDEGYAYADVTPITVPDEKEQKVNIEYQVVKGEKVHFNRISIAGNTKTRDKVIRRQLAVVEGDLFSRQKMKESYANLAQLRYFEEVDIQTEKGPDKNLMDVNIRVKEKPTGMVSFGAGYSALDSMVMSGQIVQRNLFGKGQSLGLTAAIGGRSRNYDLYFIEPWLFDMPLWSKTNLWNWERSYDTFNVESFGFGQMLGYTIFPKWRTTGYLGYRLSNDKIKDVLPTAAHIIKTQEGTTLLSGVEAMLVRDTTNDNLFPTKGSKNAVSVEYTGGLMQGDVDYTKYQASSAWFIPLPGETVFSARGRIGYIQERGDKEIPVFYRFWLGGIDSLRGLRDVGPRDPETGDFIGGLTFLNFNVEYIFNLVKNAGMKGVVFFDTGNTWNSGYHFDDMRMTAGGGIRWFSPIGPIRIEYGFVLDRKTGEPTGRWEFTIGTSM